MTSSFIFLEMMRANDFKESFGSCFFGLPRWLIKISFVQCFCRSFKVGRMFVRRKATSSLSLGILRSIRMMQVLSFSFETGVLERKLIIRLLYQI